MLGRRCTLCGGKLNSQNICTECGLDNSKSDRNYQLNQGNCDKMPMTHVHDDISEAKRFWNDRKQDDWKQNNQKQQNNQNQYSQTKERQKQKTAQTKNTKYSYEKRTTTSASTAQQDWNEWQNPAPKKKPKKRGKILIIIIIIIIVFQILGSLISVIGGAIRSIFGEFDGGYSEDYTYERSDPYADVTDTLPEEGEYEEYELTSGTYIVGVHIPAGYYSVDTNYDYDSIDVTDMEHGVYLYEYAGDENNYLQDIRLFDGAQVEIETQTTMVLKTENAQLADMEYMENPQTEEYVLDSTDLQTAGTDFAEGVYDLTVLEGRGSINVDICDAGGGVIATCYMYLGENASYGMTYQNLVLPEGAVITLDEGLSVQMTPSERIESTDYLGYYED